MKKWKYAWVDEDGNIFVAQNRYVHDYCIGNIFMDNVNYTELLGHFDLLDEIKEMLLEDSSI